MSMIFRSILAFVMLSGAGIAPARANTPEIDAVQAWLRSTNTLVADFAQTAASGKVSMGKMQMSRPGNVRFQYDPSVPLLIVGKGGWITLVDYGNAQVQRYPIADTPLSVLLNPEAKLAGMASVVNDAAADPTMLVIEAKDRKKPQFGTLRLYFGRGASPGALNLAGWTIVDGRGNRTAIQLSNVRTNVAVPSSAFTWRDPRPKTVGGKGR
jgi:outer membrane lipoprotein-sorting protein